MIFGGVVGIRDMEAVRCMFKSGFFIHVSQFVWRDIYKRTGGLKMKLITVTKGKCHQPDAYQMDG